MEADAGMPDAVEMTYADDPEGYKRRLEEKLKPSWIRATLAFAGLYQVTHEMIKRSVLDGVKGFFGWTEVFGEERWLSVQGEDDYKNSVVNLDRNPFVACLLWLVEMDAITRDQADRLDAIYDHRHDLTHELIKYIVDPDEDPDVGLFIDALSILNDLSRFWTSIEKDIGTFEQEHGDIDLDQIMPLSLTVLRMCIEAYAAMGGGESGETAT